MRQPTFRGAHWYVCLVAGIALLCIGWTAYRRAGEESLLRAHTGLMTLLVAGDFERAYQLTTDEYRANHTVEEFRFIFRDYERDKFHLQRSPTVLSFGLFSAEVFADEVPGAFEFLNGPSFSYRRERGQWRFTGKVVNYLD